MERLVDPAKLKAQTAYNAASDHFDDEPLAFWARSGSRIVERLGLPAGAKVLDVGCGTGASAIPAARAVGPTGLVIGVDLADRLLERGREKARRQRLSNVEFRKADMENLGYRDGEFDAVTAPHLRRAALVCRLKTDPSRLMLRPLVCSCPRVCLPFRTSLSPRLS